MTEKDLIIQELKQELKELKERYKWIPCSKRMPKEDEFVLACSDTGDIGTGYIEMDEEDGTYTCSTDCELDVPIYDTVAWMPLPEPYTEKER